MIHMVELPYDYTNRNILEAYTMWNETADGSFLKNPAMSMDELKSRCNFIHSLGMGILYREKVCLEEYNQWKYASPDSPWTDTDSQEAAKTLVKISQSGISSAWTGTHTKFNDVVHTEPNDVVHTEPNDVVHTEPNDVVHTEPNDVVHKKKPSQSEYQSEYQIGYNLGIARLRESNGGVLRRQESQSEYQTQYQIGYNLGISRRRELKDGVHKKKPSQSEYQSEYNLRSRQAT